MFWWDLGVIWLKVPSLGERGQLDLSYPSPPTSGTRNPPSILWPRGMARVHKIRHSAGTVLLICSKNRLRFSLYSGAHLEPYLWQQTNTTKQHCNNQPSALWVMLIDSAESRKMTSHDESTTYTVLPKVFNQLSESLNSGAQSKGHKDMDERVWCGRTWLACTECWTQPRQNTVRMNKSGDCEPGLLVQHLSDLTNALLEEWSKMSINTLLNLVEILHRRVEAAKGGPTSY